MRKNTFFGCFILFAMFALTSCDGINISADDILSDDLAGSATVVITRNGTDGPVSDSLNFVSSIVDVFNFHDVDTNLGDGYSTIDISANVTLDNANVPLEFPFMYYRLNDSVTGPYNFDTILTLDMLQNLNFDTLISILSNPDGGNMILIAQNDSCWYITYGGQMVVSSFPAVGHIVQASFSNVQAWYVTQSKVDELSNDINNMNYSHLSDVDYYFPRVTMSGNVSSRRWAVIHTIFDMAFSQGGIAGK